MLKFPVLFCGCFMVLNAQAAPSTTHHVVTASSSEVQSCLFLAEITAPSGQLKYQNWHQHAQHRASLQAEKLGATHLVIEKENSVGVFHGKVKAQAYSCSNVAQKSQHPI